MGTLMLIAGIAGCILSVAGLIIVQLITSAKKKKLRQKFEQEYGRNDLSR